MIGHYINNLKAEQEDFVLTRHLGRAPEYERADGCRCLVGAAADWSLRQALRLGDPRDSNPLCVWNYSGSLVGTRTHNWAWGVIGYEFDELCGRFGESRMAGLIRDRILSNRARRTLQNIPVGVGEDRPAL